jgi:hypothetical protein
MSTAWPQPSNSVASEGRTDAADELDAVWSGSCDDDLGLTFDGRFLWSTDD